MLHVDLCLSIVMYLNLSIHCQDVTITNDGATILKLLEVEHPAARVLCELADLQDQEVGDGTSSVVSFFLIQSIYSSMCNFIYKVLSSKFTVVSG